jgi:hypothetical protein
VTPNDAVWPPHSRITLEPRDANADAPHHADGVQIQLTPEEKKYLDEPYTPRAIVSVDRRDGGSHIRLKLTSRSLATREGWRVE